VQEKKKRVLNVPCRKKGGEREGGFANSVSLSRGGEKSISEKEMGEPRLDV